MIFFLLFSFYYLWIVLALIGFISIHIHDHKKGHDFTLSRLMQTIFYCVCPLVNIAMCYIMAEDFILFKGKSR